MILFWQNYTIGKVLTDLEDNQLKIFFLCQILFFSAIVLIYLIRKNKKTRVSSPPDSDIVYNIDCPICFDQLLMPIKSDCGHAYCIECLHTFWKKRTWKNLCPLCRQPLKNLKIIENEDCKYSNSIREVLLKQIAEMSNPYYSGFKLSNVIFTQTAFYLTSGMALLILWTWAVINTDKLIEYSMWIYNSFYNTKVEVKT